MLSEVFEPFRRLKGVLVCGERGQEEEALAVPAEACARGADNGGALEQAVKELPRIHAGGAFHPHIG